MQAVVQRLSSLVARLPYPSRTVRRVLAVAAIVTQGGIGVTGSVVRVTGSGLGCPTWPQCFAGSMFPVQHPEYHALTQWIEFGNRLLTGVVGIVAALCVLAAWRIQTEHPGRRRLVKLAWAMPGGVVAQAVIGGMTVLTGLLWWTVAIHFLASTVLVWLAVLLLHAFGEGDEPPRWRIAPAGQVLLRLLVAAMACVLVAGTIVTGAGPHGGDPDTPRLQAPIETLTFVHGGLLVVYLLVLAVLGLQWLRGSAPKRRRARAPDRGSELTRRGRAPDRGSELPLWRRYAAVWVVALAQGALGSLQTALGVPEALVSLHVLGAALVIIATASLWCAARDRGPVVGDTRAAEGRQLASAG